MTKNEIPFSSRPETESSAKWTRLTTSGNSIVVCRLPFYFKLYYFVTLSFSTNKRERCCCPHLFPGVLRLRAFAGCHCASGLCKSVSFCTRGLPVYNLNTFFFALHESQWRQRSFRNSKSFEL